MGYPDRGSVPRLSPCPQIPNTWDSFWGFHSGAPLRPETFPRSPERSHSQKLLGDQKLLQDSVPREGVCGANCAKVQSSGLALQQAAAGLGLHHSCPHSGVSNESRGQGREPFIFPLEIKQEAERVWFSLIFFFKSFLASLLHLLPIFLQGGGQRGAGNVWQLFVFNLHKPILCMCFFSFWKFSADRHFLQKS